MKIDSGFDASRLTDHFRNLSSRIDGAAAHELRKDLHQVKDAVRSGKDPAKVKDAVQTATSDVKDIVDFRQIKDSIKQVRADFRDGASPDQLKGDVEALKAKLSSFVEGSEGAFRGRDIAHSLRDAIAATMHRIRHDDRPTPTPAPVDPGPIAADGDETVTPAPGSVDFSA